MASDDKLERAKLGFEEAKSFYSEQHTQMQEDLLFSNPSEPRQWDDVAKDARRLSGRPCETFDYTNQYIMQVVNDQRMNKPGLKAIPVGSGSDIEVAECLEGMFRHIEYASRAQIAYDWAIEQAARIGLGWLRILPEVVDTESNMQEIRISRVVDSLSVMLDPDSTEPDGKDATCGWVEKQMSRKAFQRLYPKAKDYRKDDKGWYSQDQVRVCEYFEVVTERKSQLVVEIPGDYGPERATLSEDTFWKFRDEMGVTPHVLEQFWGEARSVTWMTHTADEILEETTFPSVWVPLVPVMGYELWIEGKRYLCGLPRRMRGAQIAYNVARNAELELAMMSPKQPFIADYEAVEPFKNDWAQANQGNKAVLYYNGRRDDGTPIPPPQRQMPAQPSQAFLQMAQAAIGDLEASVGMYRANLGQPSNETSGRAINARQRQGSIANYHYVDGLTRAMEHVGRIVLDMIPRVYDVQRMVQCIGEDGETKSVKLDPKLDDPKAKKGAQLIAFNPNVGQYDVRIKTGPGYASLRQEAAEQLGQMMQNPALAAAIGPIWARMQDWPEAPKLSRILLAMAPPPVQQAAEDESAEVPPAVQAQMAQMQQAHEQAAQTIQQLVQKLDEAQRGAAEKTQAEQMKQDAETQRLQMKLEADMQVAQMNDDTKRAIADLTQMVSLLAKGLQPPPLLQAAASEELAEDVTDD